MTDLARLSTMKGASTRSGSDGGPAVGGPVGHEGASRVSRQGKGEARGPKAPPGTAATEADDAFVALFDEHFESLYRYLDRMSGDPDLASDLAQEAFVRLFRRGSPPDDPRAWLFTVATNLYRNARARRSTRRRLLTSWRSLRALSDPPPPPDRAFEAGEAARAVRASLDRLTPRERAMLLLAAEGRTYREIAHVLGLNEASVGTLLRRAKEAFRAAHEETPHAS